MPVLISLAVVDIMDAIARVGSGDDDADEALELERGSKGRELKRKLSLRGERMRESAGERSELRFALLDGPRTDQHPPSVRPGQKERKKGVDYLLMGLWSISWSLNPQRTYVLGKSIYLTIRQLNLAILLYLRVAETVLFLQLQGILCLGPSL